MLTVSDQSTDWKLKNMIYINTFCRFAINYKPTSNTQFLTRILIILYYVYLYSTLAHPNVKLFISHGGISGVYETVDAGVPVLGFPLYYDQPRNLQSLVDAGMAIAMELTSVTEQQFLYAIKELVYNAK